MEARSLLSALPTDVIAFYRRAENYRRYTLADSGRVRALGTLVQREERSFGRSVLDLACGGGILGFVLESPGRRYLGVDVNPDVIDVARATARARGSTCRFRTEDATWIRVTGTFDTVTLLGNALGHIAPRGFARLLARLRGHLSPRARFLVEYRDVAELLFRRKWDARRIEHHKRGQVLIRTLGMDPARGEIQLAARSDRFPRPVYFTHAVWSPCLVETMMAAEGFVLGHRIREVRHPIYTDIYRLRTTRRPPRPGWGA